MEIKSSLDTLADLRDFLLPHRIFIPAKYLKELAEEVVRVERILNPDSTCTTHDLLKKHCKAANKFNIQILSDITNSRLSNITQIEQILELSQTVRKGEWESIYFGGSEKEHSFLKVTMGEQGLVERYQDEKLKYWMAKVESRTLGFECILGDELQSQEYRGSADKSYIEYVKRLVHHDVLKLYYRENDIKKYIAELRGFKLDGCKPEKTVIEAAPIFMKSSSSYLPFRLINRIKDLIKLQCTQLVSIGYSTKAEKERIFSPEIKVLSMCSSYLERSKWAYDRITTKDIQSEISNFDRNINYLSENLERFKSNSLIGLSDLTPESIKKIEDHLLKKLENAQIEKKEFEASHAMVDIAELTKFFRIHFLQIKTKEEYNSRKESYRVDIEPTRSGPYGGIVDSETRRDLPEKIRKELDLRMEEYDKQKNDIISDESNRVSKFLEMYREEVKNFYKNHYSDYFLQSLQ